MPPLSLAPLFTWSALCLGLLPQVVLGSAWTRPDGGLLLLAPIAYTQADEAFNEHGDRVDRRRFEMVESSPLVEYGVTDALTVGMQPEFRWVSVETASGTVTNSGLAETDLFVRHDAPLLTSYKFRKAVSLVGGASTTYAGENVGVGETAFLAITLQYQRPAGPAQPPAAAREPASPATRRAG